MTQSETDVRIAALESQLRRLRRTVWTAAVVLLVVALAVVEGYREMGDLRRYGLDTASLKIFDMTGDLRTSLGTQPGGELPYFKFVDENGHYAMFLSLEEAGPGLAFRDSAGQVRLRLAVDDDGGRIELLDADGGRVWSAP